MRNLCIALGALLIPLLPAGGSLAQPARCNLEAVAGTTRQVLRCASGLMVMTETRTGFALVDANRDGNPEAVRLDSRAVMIEVPSGAVPAGFEVVTPQAIAAVRGTRWAVDVSEGKTAVFVVEGRVSVRRNADGTEVVLEPGQGVDVTDAPGPIEVKVWGAARVAALMARFGL